MNLYFFTVDIEKIFDCPFVYLDKVQSCVEENFGDKFPDSNDVSFPKLSITKTSENEITGVQISSKRNFSRKFEHVDKGLRSESSFSSSVSLNINNFNLPEKDSSFRKIRNSFVFDIATNVVFMILYFSLPGIMKFYCIYRKFTFIYFTIGVFREVFFVLETKDRFKFLLNLIYNYFLRFMFVEMFIQIIRLSYETPRSGVSSQRENATDECKGIETNKAPIRASNYLKSQELSKILALIIASALTSYLFRSEALKKIKINVNWRNLIPKKNLGIKNFFKFLFSRKDEKQKPEDDFGKIKPLGPGLFEGLLG